MRLPGPAIVLSFAVALVLTACGPSAPAPAPTGTSTSTPSSPISTPTAEPADDGVSAAFVVVTASALSVFGTDGSTLVSFDYSGDVGAAVRELAEALGEDPVVSETDAVGGGCDFDFAAYDFGGLVIQGPGSIGSTGAYEAQLSGASTRGGVPIETVAGQQVGTTWTAFSAAVGDEVILIDDGGGSMYVGYDQTNPGVTEYEEEGAFAYFGGSVLTEVYLPHRYWTDC